MTTAFQCKQFSIADGGCAMKVGTDSFVLGAWAQLPADGPWLDIGTGCGLLALMLAQRSRNPAIRIDAVEIDAAAAVQASQNVANSPFANQIKVLEHDILTYRQSSDYAGPYQFVITNPPYFENSLATPDAQRQLARHTDQLPLSALVQAVDGLLTATGQWACILPTAQAESVRVFAQQAGWFCQASLALQSIPTKPPLRLALQFSREPTPTRAQQLLVRSEEGHYSAAYRQLLQPFYLKF